MLDYFRQQLLAAGMAPQEVSTFEDEAEAVRAGLAQARPGDLLLVLAPPEIGLPELQAARNHSKGQNA
jgi:UDP-N-acetylmuramyl tripeptide synthase